MIRFRKLVTTSECWKKKTKQKLHARSFLLKVSEKFVWVARACACSPTKYTYGVHRTDNNNEKKEKPILFYFFIGTHNNIADTIDVIWYLFTAKVRGFGKNQMNASRCLNTGWIYKRFSLWKKYILQSGPNTSLSHQNDFGRNSLGFQIKIDWTREYLIKMIAWWFFVSFAAHLNYGYYIYRDIYCIDKQIIF